MKFNREGIAAFLSKGKTYITWRTGIEPRKAKEFFYSGCNLAKQYPGVDIKYCKPRNGKYPYEVVRGDFVTGLKYVLEGKEYYIFLGANSFYEPPQSIAIGKAQEGKIYLIYEDISRNKTYEEKFIILSEEDLFKDMEEFIPKAYYHTIQMPPSKAEKDKNKATITDRDVECLRIAYEGIEVFKDLIKKFPVD